MTPEQRNRIETALDGVVAAVRPLAGGCIAEVLRLDLEDGRRIAVKLGGPRDRLDIEGRSLTALRDQGGLPTPRVHLADRDLLAMDLLPAGGGLSVAVQKDAADQVARLHEATAADFGYEEDTRIGPLHQPNPRTRSWRAFFCDHRLLYMGKVACDRGRLQASDMAAIERLAGRLDGWIDEPPRPALLHGDLWTGNVLSDGSAITGFIDPAVYYGDPEMDLAFSTLFGTFGDAFFDRYREHRPFDMTGFLEVRRDLYNLYPLLVHTALFGGGYGASAMRIVRRFLG